MILLLGSVCDDLEVGGGGAIVIYLVWQVCVIQEPLSGGANTSVGKVALAATHFVKLGVCKASIIGSLVWLLYGVHAHLLFWFAVTTYL